jgi:acylphosphatase
VNRLARHVRITGGVQGVFFRAWTRDQARELGVSGWVRNASDGSVEAHLEGALDSVEQMIERMRSGPPSARVEDLKISEALVKDLGSFEVRR